MWSRDLPAAWQQAPLPNDPIGTNWVYYEVLIISSAPVYQLTRDNLNPVSRAPPAPACTCQLRPLPADGSHVSRRILSCMACLYSCFAQSQSMRQQKPRSGLQ